MNKKVLLIGTDNEISMLLKKYDFEVLNSEPDVIYSYKPNVVITDKPEIVADIREFSDIPIIVLFSKPDDKKVIEAFNSGADECITMPVSEMIFIARINNVLSHIRVSEADKFVSDELEIDFENHFVTVNGEVVHLTPIEYSIAELLCKNPGKVLTYDYILKHIWGPYISQDNKILRVNMTNIRRKLERNSKKPEHFCTESGVGYYVR